MKRFCHECGKEARSNDNVCIHCGTRLKKNKSNEESIEQASTREKVEKKDPMPKKQKRMWQVIAVIALFIIGLSVWVNTYHSPEAVQKRFEKAISKRDTGKLEKMIIHSDGTSISKAEADAFLSLVAEEGSHIAFDLTQVVYAGKFLGIYDKHKIEAYDQFANYNNYLEGLTFVFNNEEIEAADQQDDFISYGPLAPGIYDVEALFESEYGDATVEGSITLSNYSPSDYEWIEMDIPIANVTFYIENFDEIDISESYIEVNDEKLSISEEGKTEKIGPLLIDGSIEAEMIASMPWGEVATEPLAIEDTDMFIYANLLSSDDYENVLDTIEKFGEEYVESMAAKSTKPFQSVSTAGKKMLKNELPDGYEYTGQFDLVEIDKHSMFVDEAENTPEIKIQTAYHLQEDYHDLNETPELYDEIYSWVIALAFDKEDEHWLITSVNSSNMWGGIEATDERKGSGDLHGPSKEAIAEATERDLNASLEIFIEDYTEASVDAINYRDFSLVSDYIAEEGPRYKEAREYIDYLDSQDIYEEWYGSELENVKKIDDNTWEVTVIEEFDIIRPDSSDVKKFRTSLIVNQVNDEFYVMELTETNEI